MPTPFIRLLSVLVGEGPEHPPCLFMGVFDDQREVASLVLSVQLVAGRGSDKSGRTFLTDAPSSETLCTLFYKLIVEPSFGEECPYRVLLHLAAARSFGEDEVAVRKRLLSIVERLLRERSELVNGPLGKEAHHTRDEEGLTSRRWAFDCHAHDLVKQAAGQG